MYKRAKHISSIGTQLHQFSQQYNIPIVCINQVSSSIAHFHSDYEGHQMYKRVKHISSIGTQLHQFSQQYNIPIVCINQVS